MFLPNLEKASPCVLNFFFFLLLINVLSLIIIIFLMLLNSYLYFTISSTSSLFCVIFVALILFDNFPLFPFLLSNFLISSYLRFCLWWNQLYSIYHSTYVIIIIFKLFFIYNPQTSFSYIPFWVLIDFLCNNLYNNKVINLVIVLIYESSYQLCTSVETRRLGRPDIFSCLSRELG